MLGIAAVGFTLNLAYQPLKSNKIKGEKVQTYDILHLGAGNLSWLTAVLPPVVKTGSHRQAILFLFVWNSFHSMLPSERDFFYKEVNQESQSYGKQAKQEDL